MDRISPGRRPSGRAAGYHVWSELLFIHWRVPIAVLQPLVPAELTIDTFDGSAWIGLVPFRMSGVRPWWSPPVWGISQFPETNVRTYVHFQGRDPGVWFFSLEAANWLAVQMARRGWGLNYQWAKMSVAREGQRRIYKSHRIGSGVVCNVEADVGEPFPGGCDYLETKIANPGTLEHFLVERYFLYARQRVHLYQGQVHHRPYPLYTAQVARIEQHLLASHGIGSVSEPEHVLFSPQVNVEVFPLKQVCRIDA